MHSRQQAALTCARTRLNDPFNCDEEDSRLEGSNEVVMVPPLESNTKWFVNASALPLRTGSASLPIRVSHRAWQAKEPVAGRLIDATTFRSREKPLYACTFQHQRAKGVPSTSRLCSILPNPSKLQLSASWGRGFHEPCSCRTPNP